MVSLGVHQGVSWVRRPGAGRLMGAMGIPSSEAPVMIPRVEVPAVIGEGDGCLPTSIFQPWASGPLLCAFTLLVTFRMFVAALPSGHLPCYNFLHLITMG